MPEKRTNGNPLRLHIETLMDGHGVDEEAGPPNTPPDTDLGCGSGCLIGLLLIVAAGLLVLFLK